LFVSGRILLALNAVPTYSSATTTPRPRDTTADATATS